MAGERGTRAGARGILSSCVCLALIAGGTAGGSAGGTAGGTAGLAAHAPDDETARIHAARAAEAAGAEGDEGLARLADGLIETGRLRFPVPYVANAPMLAVPGTGIVYSEVQEGAEVRAILAFDLRTGQRVAEIDLLPRFGDRELYGMAIGGEGALRRLALTIGETILLFDISDPRQPREIGVVAGTCGGRVHARPGPRPLFLDSRDGCLAVFDGTDGALVWQDHPPGSSWVNAEGAVFTLWTSSQRMLWSFEILDGGWFSPLAGPLPAPSPAARLNPAGDRLLTTAASGARELRDPRTLAVTAALPDASGPVLLADGGPQRAVIEVRDGSVGLTDITDPASPRVLPDLAVDMRGTQPTATSLRDFPWVILPSPGTGEVVVADLRDGTIAARIPTGDLVPLAVVADEVAAQGGPAEGGPLIGIAARDRDEASVLLAVSLADPSAPRLVSRYRDDWPARVGTLATVDGRAVAVYDRMLGALIVADAASGRPLGAGRMRRDGSWGAGGLRALGPRVVAWNRDEARVFEVADESVVPRQAWNRDAWSDAAPTDAALLPDGRLVLLAGAEIHVVDAAGATASVDLPGAPLAVEPALQLSPDGRLLLADPGGAWASPWAPSAPSVFDVSGAGPPVLLWTGGSSASSARFVRSGTAVVVVASADGWSVRPRLHDARTGAPLGGEGPAFYPFFYFGPGAAFGTGKDARIVYWEWTPIGWDDVLLDVGQETPAIVATSPEYFAGPAFAPRDETTFYRILQRGAADGNPLDVGDLAGVYAPYGRIALHEPVSLRHGFLAGADAVSRSRDVVLARDPKLNRPPQAVAGPDHVLECAGASTPAVLDGSGSSDPDSTPGTADDIGRYAWSVDGRPRADTPRAEVGLEPGAHEAVLRVEDRLGAAAEDRASLEVVDTTAPDVTLRLAPVMAGRTWTQRWIPEGVAEDACDGALDPGDDTLWLDRAALDGPVTISAGVQPEVRVRRIGAGFGVSLTGPDAGALRAWWADARARGGLRLRHGAPVGLVLASAPGDVAGVYTLAPDGRVDRAVANGPGADLVVVSRAADRAGNHGEARASLREAIDVFCAGLPAGVACAGR